MPDPRPIDPAKLRGTLGVLTDHLARGDYEGLCRFARTSRIGAEDVERVVREYGRHLVPIPVAALQAVDVVSVADSYPQRWSVVLPLWSKEEGHSDLSLELTVEDSPAPEYRIDIDDLHVL
jgi:hypothetical protein